MSQAPQEPPAGPPSQPSPADGRRRTQPLGGRRNRGRSRRRSQSSSSSCSARTTRTTRRTRPPPRRPTTPETTATEEATTEEATTEETTTEEAPTTTEAGPPPPQRVVVVVRNGAARRRREARGDRAGRPGRAHRPRRRHRRGAPARLRPDRRRRARAAGAHQRSARRRPAYSRSSSRSAASRSPSSSRHLTRRDPYPLAHGLGGVRDLPVPGWLFYWGASIVLVVSFVALWALWQRPLLAEASRGRPLPEARGDRVEQRAPDPPRRRSRSRSSSSSSTAAAIGDTSPDENLAPRFVFVYFWLGRPGAQRALRERLDGAEPVAGGRRRRRLDLGAHRPPLGDAVRVPGAARAAGRAPSSCSRSRPSSSRTGTTATRARSRSRSSSTASSPGSRCSPTAATSGPRTARRFAVYFGLLARIAPFGGARDGRLVVRWPFTGLANLDARPGTLAFIAVMLGSVAFDGFSQTDYWAVDVRAKLTREVIERSPDPGGRGRRPGRAHGPRAHDRPRRARLHRRHEDRGAGRALRRRPDRRVPRQPRPDRARLRRRALLLVPRARVAVPGDLRLRPVRLRLGPVRDGGRGPAGSTSSPRRRSGTPRSRRS